MSDDNSKLVPLLPISNRTVKRFSADDSVHTYVKVGHRQTPYKAKAPHRFRWGAFALQQSNNMTYCNAVTRRCEAASCGETHISFIDVKSVPK